MEWNRVWSIGRDTYIRFCPNPGFGVSFGQRRIAVSWYGGIEVFKKIGGLWVRVWKRLSRVKYRPGGRC